MAATVITTIFCLFVYFSSPLIVSDGITLLARNAEIPLKFLANAEIIAKERQFEELGRNLDARAWVCIQASVKKLVKIEVEDPQDPTPYWLLTTRHPEKLVQLVNNS